MGIDVVRRHSVTVTGAAGAGPMVFAHGFGADQQMWRFVAPAFAERHRIVSYDHAGCGRAKAAYDDARHATLHGYAQDLVDILEALDLRGAVGVGHSVGAQILLLASIAVPERFSRLVLLAPSPRYLNDPPDYVGGFERADIDGLMDMLDRNLLGWAKFLAPVAMGPASPPALTEEMSSSLAAGDPHITRRFAETIFLSDHRADLPRVTTPALIVQCSDDTIVPPEVGEYLHAQLRGSTLRTIDAVGHCPHMSHPRQTIDLMRAWLHDGA